MTTVIDTPVGQQLTQCSAPVLAMGRGGTADGRRDRLIAPACPAATA
jgi:hypothetical protein